MIKIVKSKICKYLTLYINLNEAKIFEVLQAKKRVSEEENPIKCKSKIIGTEFLYKFTIKNHRRMINFSFLRGKSGFYIFLKCRSHQLSGVQ